MQRRGIDFRRDSRQRKQRLGLGSECETAWVPVKVDRLDAQAVAPHDQPLAKRVPKREAEHAVQPVDEFVAVLRVAVEDDLAVRRSLEPMAERFQLAAQLTKVVDLAVTHEPQRAVAVRQGLVPAGKIDNREAPHANGAWAVHVVAFVVWPSVKN